MLTGLTGEAHGGEWVHVWGPNGAGKSTLLRVLAGFHRPEAGKVLWNEESIYDDLEDYRQHVRYVGDEPALMSELKVIDNWQLYSSLFGLSGASSAQLSQKLSLDQRVSNLSHGQKKRVQLATLFGAEPDLLLIDEPMLALDGEAEQALNKRLHQLQEAGSIVITASPKSDSESDRLWKLQGRS